MKYLFANGNQGYFTTYHPFETDLVLDQEFVDKVLREHVPGAGRTGTYVEHLIEIIIDRGHKADYWSCECCGTKVKAIEKPNLNDWVVLEGITGNY